MNSERGVHRERGDVFTGERVRPICLAKGRVEALRAKNAALANTQKELDGYLETKRVIFPRFYFLTNEEIVLFLASARGLLDTACERAHAFYSTQAGRNLKKKKYRTSTPFRSVRAPEELAALVVKCFDGLSSLRLNARSETEAIVSPEGETVMIPPVKYRFQMEMWLTMIEAAMHGAVSEQIGRALAAFAEMEVPKGATFSGGFEGIRTIENTFPNW